MARRASIATIVTKAYRFDTVLGLIFEADERDGKNARAEGAIDVDAAVLVGHRSPLVRRKPADHIADMVDIASAAFADRDGIGHPDFALIME